MIKPGLLSIIAPVIASLVFSYVSYRTGSELIISKMIYAFLLFSIGTGALLALFFSNGYKEIRGISTHGIIKLYLMIGLVLIPLII